MSLLFVSHSHSYLFYMSLSQIVSDVKLICMFQLFLWFLPTSSQQILSIAKELICNMLYFSSHSINSFLHMCLLLPRFIHVLIRFSLSCFVLSFHKSDIFESNKLLEYVVSFLTKSVTDNTPVSYTHLDVYKRQV